MQNLQPKIKAIQQRYAGNQVVLKFEFDYLSIPFLLVGMVCFDLIVLLVLFRKEYNWKHLACTGRLGLILWQVSFR